MGRLLNSSSTPCAPSSLSLFNTPASQVAFTKAQDLTFVPAFSTDSNGPYTFHICDSTHFLQLNETYISFKLQIDKSSVDLSKIAPTNFIGCTFFNQIKCSVNNVQLYDSSFYAYKSYLEAMFAPREVRESLLSAAGFVDDDHTVDINDTSSSGFSKRQNRVNADGTIDVCAPVLFEPFMTENLLLPHINLQITFYRNPDAFILQATEDLKGIKLTVTDMKLHVRAIEVTSAAALAVENRLRTTPARYPFTACRVKQISVPGGRQDLPYTLISNDILPRRIVLALVDPQALEGSLTTSSFAFGHYNTAEVSLDAGGQIYPAQPMPTNFKDGSHAHHLVKLLSNLTGGHRSTMLSYDSLLNGHCLWAFNLSAYSDSQAWELVKNGSLQLQMKFREKTPASGLTILCWCYYDNQFLIDSWRNAHLENPL